MQNSMRSTILKAQLEMTNLNTELTTGKYADIGLALGANTARSLDLNREVDRISGIVSVNSIATQRLEASQAALEAMRNAANDIQGVLVPNTDSSDPTLETVNATITSALNSFTSFANTNVNGEYLFSGINTDVTPVDDYFGENSTLNKAFKAELDAFMFTNGVSTKADMTVDMMEDFMADIEAKFNGTVKVGNPPHDSLPVIIPPAVATADFWTEFGSSASDVNMTSRITQTEVVESSTNANSRGMRYFALAGITSVEFLTSDVKPEVRELVATKSVANIKAAIDGLNQQASKLGLSESRITKANDALEAQKAIIQNHLIDIEGIDTYEAKTRLDLLQSQIEIAYSLTARLQEMSLVNYL